MMRAIGVLLAALGVGAVFNMLNVPAGWLLGALLTGILYGLLRSDVSYEGWPFKIALTLVGTNIGLLMERELFSVLGVYILPLFITIIVTLAGGLLFGWLLYKWSSILDKRTALFCCIPGGASEIISVSGDYGADNRIVAAFHTARITFFVLLIPLIAGLWAEAAEAGPEQVAEGALTLEHIIVFLIVMSIAFYLNFRIKIPAGSLLYAIAFGFLFGDFIFHIDDVPTYIGGIGQALIGVMVGVRFDRPTFLRLKQIGGVSAQVLGLFFILSFFLAFIFWLFTEVSYVVSLLSTVPAGAAEMAATAFALGLEPTLVASLQIIRVISVFLALPIILKLVEKM
ncbi:AbrB family transcriptional regulator [Salsuginibacillus kocurii]|uniref:AbrB family transcriptional regulator n=1 Tax=Salsuginibacillus kocurii TaxID=427078 RepID=UPI00035F7B48|nr:AbrB family transcriptional regulator [Salsuginibacillus kocurii]